MVHNNYLCLTAVYLGEPGSSSMNLGQHRCIWVTNGKPGSARWTWVTIGEPGSPLANLGQHQWTWISWFPLKSSSSTRSETEPLGLVEWVYFTRRMSFLQPNQSTEGRQNINPDQWLDLILSASTTRLLTEGTLLPLCQLSDQSFGAKSCEKLTDIKLKKTSKPLREVPRFLAPAVLQHKLVDHVVLIYTFHRQTNANHCTVGQSPGCQRTLPPIMHSVQVVYVWHNTTLHFVWVCGWQ